MIPSVVPSYSCGGFFTRTKAPAAMSFYMKEFRKADARRGADLFDTASLHFVDVRERRLLVGARSWGLTPVVGGFVGRRSFHDAHIIHTAYRVFFEYFFGLYVDAEYVEGLVEDLGLVPEFQKERKGHVYYVLGLKQLLRIIGYVGRTHTYTPLYERGLPRTLEDMLARRTVGLSSQYMAVDGAAAVLNEAKSKEISILLFLDMDDPRGVREGHTLYGVDPFLLDDLEGIRSWLNHVRYKLLQTLTRVSRKVVRRIQEGRVQAVFALSRRKAVAPSTDPSIALVAKYVDLAEERRDLEAAPSWFGKKLNRVVPLEEVTSIKRTPVRTLEIIEENVRDDELHCEESA